MDTQVNRWRWLLTLTFFNTLIIALCGIPAVMMDPIPQLFAPITFYLLTYIAQSFLFAAFLGILLTPIFLFIRSDYLKIIFSLFPVWITLLFSFMNAKVFAFWRVFINGSLLRMYFSKGGGSQVFEVRDTMYVWIVVVVIVFFVIATTVLFLSRAFANHVSLKKKYIVLMLIYVLAQSGLIVFCAHNDMRLLKYTIKVPYFYDLSWTNVLDDSRHQSFFPKNSLAQQLHETLLDTKPLDYPLHPLQYHLPAQPLNVLLIVVDTLRYDMINPMNMPHVYHFATHADQFLDNISGGDCTRPGIFSLFYGIPATYWNEARDHLQGSIIIRAFQANHYHLGIYASAPLLSPPFDKTVFATVKHFQTITPGETPIDRDEKITQQMQDFLKIQAKTHHPFFGFMFYDVPHAYNALTVDHPFHPIGFLNYFTIDNHTSPVPFYNLYQNAVLIDDHLIETIFQTLKKDHLMQNTVVIITADHGQEFNDHHNNYWEHASGFSKYQVRTPMIIAWPNRASGIFHYQTSHFDLAPTLLKRILGVVNPVRDYSIGKDFFSDDQTNTIIVGNYAYFALITPTKIMQFHDSGMYHLTNLNMTPLDDAQISKAHLLRMLREMRRYG